MTEIHKQYSSTYLLKNILNAVACPELPPPLRHRPRPVAEPRHDEHHPQRPRHPAHAPRHFRHGCPKRISAFPIKRSSLPSSAQEEMTG